MIEQTRQLAGLNAKMAKANAKRKIKAKTQSNFFKPSGGLDEAPEKMFRQTFVGKKEFASDESGTGSLKKPKARPQSGRDPKRENINFEPEGQNAADVFNKTRSDDDEAQAPDTERNLLTDEEIQKAKGVNNIDLNEEDDPAASARPRSEDLQRSENQQKKNLQQSFTSS